MSIPDTSWQPEPTILTGDYSLSTAEAIVDENGVALVDPTDSSIAIVSPDTTFTPIADTEWVKDDSNE